MKTKKYGTSIPIACTSLIWLGYSVSVNCPRLYHHLD